MLINMTQDDDGEVPLVKAFQVNKNFSIYGMYSYKLQKYSSSSASRCTVKGNNIYLKMFTGK